MKYYCCVLLIFFSACSYLPEAEFILPETVEVDYRPDYIHFYHRDAAQVTNSVALVFYPGGLVDPHVYRDWQAKLVSQNPHIQVFSLRVAANLAVFEAIKGASLVKKFKNINQWYVGGHSLGGAMACVLVDNERNMFAGLVLMAAYPAESNDLSDWQGKVLNLYAENDGLADTTTIKSKARLLPPGLIINRQSTLDFVAGQTYNALIFGGNHAKFGNYGQQNGDGIATVSTEEQQEVIINYLEKFLK